MISRAEVTDIQDGHIRTTEMELEADMKLTMTTNKVNVVSAIGDPLFRMGLSAAGELQYESYDSIGEQYRSAVLLTPATGKSVVMIQSQTIPVTGTTMVGFTQGFAKGSKIAFSLVNQQLTLQPGDYVLQGRAQVTATNATGLLTFFPHSVAAGTSARLGSPTAMYTWQKTVVSSTGNTSDGASEVFVSVVGSPLVVDVRCDTATNISAVDYIQVVARLLD